VYEGKKQASKHKQNSCLQACNHIEATICIYIGTIIVFERETHCLPLFQSAVIKKSDPTAQIVWGRLLIDNFLLFLLNDVDFSGFIVDVAWHFDVLVEGMSS
jgi:hypothetical protein